MGSELQSFSPEEHIKSQSIDRVQLCPFVWGVNMEAMVGQPSCNQIDIQDIGPINRRGSFWCGMNLYLKHVTELWTQ